MRNASVHQGENERQWKKREQEHGSFWKFHLVDVQNNGKEMFNKVCCTRKVVILLIGPIVFFSVFAAFASKHYTILYFAWVNHKQKIFAG